MSDRPYVPRVGGGWQVQAVVRTGATDAPSALAVVARGERMLAAAYELVREHVERGALDAVSFEP